MSTTAIEWTDATWNPVTGCDRVSPGCAHCYALDLAARLKAMGQPRYQRDGDAKTSGPGFGLTLHPDKLDEPLHWRKPRMVFVNSMSDLFHEQVPDDYIARVFAVMNAARRHTFQVLTKRPGRMRALLLSDVFWDRVDHWSSVMRNGGARIDGEPLPNVWLGVSIENRRYVGRADLLRETPAAVRFISAEPLLGPLVQYEPSVAGVAPAWSGERSLNLDDIDWLIGGGEFGPKHRPMRPEWIRDLRDYAQLSETAFFFKQWGGRTPKAGGRELDGRTWDELPIVQSNHQLEV